MSASRLSALDAAFLAIESEHAPMHVGWAALFRPPPEAPAPSFEAIRDHIGGRLHRAPRYRQRLAGVPLGLGDPVWVDDPSFDIDEHVLRASHGDFGQLVDEVMSQPLQHGRALWELWIAELDDGRIAVAGKAHHCLVDGLAAVELMALLLDATCEPEPGAGGHDGWLPRALPSAATMVGDAASARAGDALALARLPLGWLRDPRSLRDVPARAWRVAQAVVHTAQPLATPSRLNGAMTSTRHLARVSRPFEDLRVIKRHFGALAPRAVRRAAGKVLGSPRPNLTISNIPGPSVPLYLMGCEVQRAYPIVPLTDGHGISIGMTTIHERACFGIYAQSELAGDADRIARGIGEAIDELLELAQAA